MDQVLAAPEQVRESSPFPIKLHDMLDHLEQQQHVGSGRDIISWQPHGRCFIIHNAKALTETLLPHYKNYFNKITKIASFQRQLNLYGFQRITQGPDRGAYYHECFLRGKTHLLTNLHRIKVKGTGVRAKSNPEEEPNFYAMPFVAPTGAAAETSNNNNMTTIDESQAAAIVPLSYDSSSDDEHDESCEQLCEWGRTFYALDNLPDDMSNNNNTANAAPVTLSSSMPSSMHLMEDKLNGDLVLQTMMAKADESSCSSSEEELDEILEHVISWGATPPSMVAI